MLGVKVGGRMVSVRDGMGALVVVGELVGKGESVFVEIGLRGSDGRALAAILVGVVIAVEY
jgi:hypothetical protein